jgi:hypothetical protein
MVSAFRNLEEGERFRIVIPDLREWSDTRRLELYGLDENAFAITGQAVNSDMTGSGDHAEPFDTCACNAQIPPTERIGPLLLYNITAANKPIGSACH